MKRFPPLYLAILYLFIGSLAGLPVQAQQVAHVAAIQRVVEKKPSAGNWLKIRKNGASLAVSESLRTGKRSKVDVKFTDGSLVRLGQLSSMEIRNTKDVALTRGELLFSMLKPGRVLAGTAAAEIKGSVGIVRFNDDGSITFILFATVEGAPRSVMDVVTTAQTVNLEQGFQVTLRPDGTLSPVSPAPPLQFIGGAIRPELLDQPARGPYTGSIVNARVRRIPERVTMDENVPRTIPETVSRDPYGGGLRLSPIPTPFPTISPPAGPGPVPTPTLRPPPAALVGLGRRSYQVDGGNVGGGQVDGGNRGNPGADAMAGMGMNAADDLSLLSAYRHLGEVDRTIGHEWGGNAMLLGVIGDSGTYGYGAHLRGFGARGKFFFDVAVTPLRIRADTGATKNTFDFTAISSFYALYRDRWGEVQVGRQRFVEGPTQAAIFGSLIRQGGREIMDGIRISPRINDDVKAEVAYLYDAFPRNLPYQIGGAQKAWYGRVATQQTYGNFGLNVLKYTNAPAVADNVGITGDFALPVVRDEVEFYGEVGRDTLRRPLTTVGLAFPGLYEKTGFDVYLEHARLRNKGAAVAPPKETTVRVYRKIGRRISLLATLSHFASTDTTFTLGISVGAETSTRRDDF